jgi:hypothetical protein
MEEGRRKEESGRGVDLVVGREEELRRESVLTFFQETLIACVITSQQMILQLEEKVRA